jgi:ribose transport system permease protein
MDPIADTTVPELARAETLDGNGPTSRDARQKRFRWPRKTVFWIAWIDLLLILGFGVLSRNNAYLTLDNFQNVSLDASQIVLLAMGETLLLGAGLFDISLGANLILSSVIGGKVVVALTGTVAQESVGRYPHLAIGVIGSVLACIGVGALVGLINGLVVTRLKVNSLIATLAMLGIATGAADLISQGSDVTNVPTSLQTGFGTVNFLGVIPDPALLTTVIGVVLWWLVTKTRFGLHTVTIGSSRMAAVRAGLRVERHECVLFVLVGAIAGLAGFLDLARFATTNIAGHQIDALAAISGSVIGGTSLFGGVASIGGAMIGALLSVILQTGLVVVNLQSFWQLIVVGIVLILAVHVDARRRDGVRVFRRLQAHK